MERQLSPSEKECFKKLRRNYFGLSNQFHKTEDFNARIKAYCIKMYSSRRVFGSTLGEDVFKYFATKCDCKIFVSNDKSLEKKNRVQRSDFDPQELAMFWGNEMEPKVKRLMLESFGLKILESEMYVYERDAGIVAKPDGIVLDQDLPKDCFECDPSSENNEKNNVDTISFVTNETHSALKKNGLLVEIKVMYSQKVPNYPRVDNLLQSIQEMACSGVERCLLVYYYPSCTKIWMIRFDSDFWIRVLEPMVTKGSYEDDSIGVKVGGLSSSPSPSFDGSQKSLSSIGKTPIFFSIIDQTLENQVQLDPETLTIRFNQRLSTYLEKNARLVFLAEKSSSSEGWSYYVHDHWKSHFNQDKFESFNATLFATLF